VKVWQPAGTLSYDDGSGITRQVPFQPDYAEAGSVSKRLSLSVDAVAETSAAGTSAEPAQAKPRKPKLIPYEIPMVPPTPKIGSSELERFLQSAKGLRVVEWICSQCGVSQELVQAQLR